VGQLTLSLASRLGVHTLMRQHNTKLSWYDSRGREMRNYSKTHAIPLGVSAQTLLSRVINLALLPIPHSSTLIQHIPPIKDSKIDGSWGIRRLMATPF